MGISFNLVTVCIKEAFFLTNVVFLDFKTFNLKRLDVDHFNATYFIVHSLENCTNFTYFFTIYL